MDLSLFRRLVYGPRAPRYSAGMAISISSLACILLLATCDVQAAQDKPAPEPLPPGLDAAIDRGLLFLQKQQRANGSFDAAGPPAAATALGLLAFLSAGHVPDLGKYGLTIHNAVDYLVNLKPDQGYFGRDGGRMYGHCAVTIALAEVYGAEMDETQRKRVRSALEKAMRLIGSAQDIGKDKEHIGGWRYEPDSRNSDLSASTWCILALRACRDAGLDVPKDRFERARSYVLRCYRTQARDPRGGFAYTPHDEVTPSMTAAGLLGLCLLDAADCEEALRAIKYLAENPFRDNAPNYHCALYYVALAGCYSGQQANWKQAAERLMGSQHREEGSFSPRNGELGGEDRAGRFYPTAMSVLMLSIPLRLLPMYQK